VNDSNDTWWKRFFTVVQIVVGLFFGISFFYAATFTEIPRSSKILFFGVLFVVIIHLIKVAFCYIIEGPKEPPPDIKPPSKPTPPAKPMTNPPPKLP